MDLELAGKVAVVTGASAGIGRGIAKVLAAEGAQTVVIARRTNLLETLQDEIEKAGGKRPLAVTGDLHDGSVPERVRAQALERFGAIDILVNCGGGGLSHAEVKNPKGTAGLAVDAMEHTWESAISINLTAVRRMAQAFLPIMQERKWGRIINITGSMEPKNSGAHHAAKAGVHAWAKGLSREIAKYGITINCLAPGRIHSEQIDTLIYPTRESQEQFAKANIPVGYFGEPYDMAYMVTFLCSPKARYITGQRLAVDGGLYHVI